MVQYDLILAGGTVITGAGLRRADAGVRTLKFFLTYLKQGWYTDDYQLIRAMICSPSAGA
jgi:hypothetical protein